MIPPGKASQLESESDETQIGDGILFTDTFTNSDREVIPEKFIVGQHQTDHEPNNGSENIYAKHSKNSSNGVSTPEPLSAKTSIIELSSCGKSENPVKTANALFDNPESPHVHLPFHTEKLPLNGSLINKVIDESDGHHSSTPHLKPSPQNTEGLRSKHSTVHRILSNPSTPYVLALYLQLFFNILLVSIIGYFVYSFVSTVRADVEHKIEDYALDILQEISVCSREYIRNNCDPLKRVPALEKSCLAWEKCMNRDPALVGRAKLGAETFAEIIDGFVKPISWKTIFFLLLLFLGSIILANSTFGSYRKMTSSLGHSDTQ
ncbi:Nuclear envelope morphology [Komagataella phaffii CBS 7435]|uniref:Essential nuclear envelope integral membrane protein required for nuclear transport n=2 Tax=Komagataella phaffii TaxID=460519 RepID=C4QYY4_KOMPG|nr:Essential nuclear envelope integral membrane protein required for nuclear transport [Komagataella phaffii GS115]AOA60395.1 GQ67_01540T0 [Komagataella phaffii]CAH2447284.1 Nuclear envelope morphology [Komagataella phaffii CBS 7435]AOA66379.1 GQ68_01556T0 [Komagataella phaffii GS115]CAY68458.1 Essential nuclear envelope integral membrane protein required for nuclear transport [Komagataella phaffii GS115]CCA37523.1 Nuclear envelope morphology [Komagataella phaffii CBS 7435]